MTTRIIAKLIIDGTAYVVEESGGVGFVRRESQCVAEGLESIALPGCCLEECNESQCCGGQVFIEVELP